MSDKPDGQGLTVDLMLRPEWAAAIGIDKNLLASAVNVAAGIAINLAYAVPAGKTLYLQSFSFSEWAMLVADSELNQIVSGDIWNITTSTGICYVGGNGGAAITFPKPLAFSAGTVVKLFARNGSGHGVELTMTAQGYEV